MISLRTTFKLLYTFAILLPATPTLAIAGDPPAKNIRPSAEAKFVGRSDYNESYSEVKLRVGNALNSKLKSGAPIGQLNIEHTRTVGVGITGDLQPDYSQFRINGLGAGRNIRNGDYVKMGPSIVMIHHESGIPELPMNGFGGLVEFQKHIAGPLRVYGEGQYAGVGGLHEEASGSKIDAQGYSLNTEAGLAVGVGKVKKTGEKRVSLKAGLGYQKAAFTGQETKILQSTPSTSVVETTEIKKGRDNFTKNITVGVVF